MDVRATMGTERMGITSLNFMPNPLFQKRGGSIVARVQAALHAYFLPLLIAAYLLAAFAPGPGLWVREVTIERIALWGTTTKIGLPAVMLGFLLFSAGLGAKLEHLKNLTRRPWVPVIAIVANFTIPLLFILIISQLMRFWNDSDETQNLLTGLALVASMPIAGSAAAWTQNENGDLALSLGLVFGSTLLSPLTTPIVLNFVALLTTGDLSEDLHELAAGGSEMFLMICVLTPSLLGLAVRFVLGSRRLDERMTAIKLMNSIVLLGLCYSNAAVSLPRVFADFDGDYLAIVLVIVVLLCVTAFAGGWLLARLARVEPAQRAALMFGLGMNNNGSGLVLAVMALANHPLVMLPIIFYNLVQHLIAGTVAGMMRRPRGKPAERVEIERPAATIERPAEALSAGFVRSTIVEA